MYLSFYALTEPPFRLTPDPDFLYLSQSHREALAHLEYGVEARSGFVLVTGEVGSGKTTLLRTLLRTIGDKVLLSQVTNTKVTYKELLELIVGDFGLNPNGHTKAALLSLLNEFLVERFREGRSCLLVVDEAQNLGSGCLEGLRMLSNLETEKTKLLQTILVGQPGLNGLIDSPGLEQLRQRISVRYHLGPLSAGETAEYISHRLSKVSSDPERAPVFPDEVIPRLHELTGGIPRLVNSLCDAALLHGYVAEKRVIDAGLIESASDQIPRSMPQPVPSPTDPQDRFSARLAEVERQLKALSMGGSRYGALPATPADLRQKLLAVRKKEAELDAREKLLSHRTEALDRREGEFGRRWAVRLREFGLARQELLAGRVAFPPLHVRAYDPDPELCAWLEECFRGAQIGCEASPHYDVFLEAAREPDPGAEFLVILLGACPHEGLNQERLKALAAEFPHYVTIYLGDVDLSTIRRRMLVAGAHNFLEKPNKRAGPEVFQSFRELLLPTVRRVHEQQRKWVERLL
jgi:general secretion pathway protein A